MLKKLMPILVGLVLIGYIYTKLPPLKSTGAAAPEIEGTLANGENFKLSDLKGQYVLVDFWGSWCPPCRQANKKLVRLYKDHNEAGFEIVSVAIEKNEKTWQKAIEKDQLSWPYHVLRQSRLVATDALALKYTVTDLPSLFLLDKEHNIIGTNLSYEEMDSYLKEKLQ